MKKFLAVLTALTLLITACTLTLTGCRNDADTQGEKPSVVTTVFPLYDWVKNILGGGADRIGLTMLLDNGVDLHSYRPSVDDMVKISNCDLFLYVGGESDAWVADALKNPRNPNRKVLNLMELLGDAVKNEEPVGSTGAHEEEHDHDHDHDHDHEDEKDEHVWLSLRNAMTVCRAVAEELSALDPESKDRYENNLLSYTESLRRLDTEYREAVAAGKRKTLLFADRFPFRYLVDDYGLTYYAAFSGCSAETEASFETVTFLAGKVDELDLPCVLTIEGSDHRIAETVVQNTKAKNQQILTMDSLQGTTSKDVADGAGYLSLMRKNLEVLKTALR